MAARVDRRPHVLAARGALAAERALLREIEAARTAAADLSRPIRIVVPSISLRLHVLACLAREFGGLLGVSCHTLHNLAVLVLERNGVRRSGSAELFGLLARRFAREDESLQDALGDLHDGYGSVVGTVRDLLDAGFDSAHLDALDETLREEGALLASTEELDRSRGLLRVAARTAEALAALGAEHPLKVATELVVSGTARLPAVHKLLVHGFADATGLAADFLVALGGVCDTAVIVDQPPDPADPAAPDPGVAFTHRLVDRLTPGAAPDEAGVEAFEAPHISLFRTVGAEAEIREVGLHIVDLLAAGTEPEQIGIVARDRGAYELQIRRQFGRLGVPFSGLASSSLLRPHGRRARAIAELLQRGTQVRVERWIDARNPDGLEAPAHDLLTAAGTLGATTLAALTPAATEVLGDRGLALPVRHGLRPLTGESGAQSGRVATRRRRISARKLTGAAHRARELSQLLAAWPERASAEDHLTAFSDVLSTLGWSPTEGLGEEVLTRVEGAFRGCNPTVGRDEFVLVIAQRLQAVGRDSLGGDGGGVQVLDVTEARGRTFAALFVIGLNRGSFPRNVREDPILPDALRKALAHSGHGVLPDLPIKRRAFDEERYLFAELLSACLRVTLSWQEADDDSQSRSPSPLVERLRFSARGRDAAWEAVPLENPLGVPIAGLDEVRQARRMHRPADELAAVAGQLGARSAFAAALALAERRASGEAVPPARVRARLAILAELDSAPDRWTRLGPYFGLVGEPHHPIDPRIGQEIWITPLERLIVCPWQTFLRRVLGLEPLPDPHAALPRLETRWIGNVVHATLEEIVGRAGVPSDVAIDELLDEPGQAVNWPGADEIERIALDEARGLAAQEGIAFPGFVPSLAAMAAAHVQTLSHSDWSDGMAAGILAAEGRGSAEIDGPGGERREVRFRADRVDREATGLRLTDYKTGRVPDGADKPAKVVEMVARGRLLQGAAYSASLRGATGRYVYLPADRLQAPTVIEMHHDDEQIRDAFSRAGRTALATWDGGAFFPRLVEPRKDREPPACRWCEVSEACLRGDSGARQRLRRWAMKRQSEAEPTGAVEPIATLWPLGPERKWKK